MTLIGIDPGKSGGIAWLQDGICSASKMPDTEKDVHSLFRRIGCGPCIIEKVHSMPGQGVKSMFTFGQNYGFLRGCLISMGVSFDEITPQTWQKALGCWSKGNKNITKAKAQQLYPSMTITHATADALLILEYLRRRELGQTFEATIAA